jgi:hypothetical protein
MLVTDHDILHIHKLLGFGCLTHYAYRIFNKMVHGSMGFESKPMIAYLTPIAHLSLSLSSFIFPVPEYRFNCKTIIWKELQLHNVIFTSRSVFIMYHSLMCKNYDAWYYYTRLGIVVAHHMMADIVSSVYQKDNKTSTRDIPYSNNTLLNYLLKKYYAFSQLVAVSNLMLTRGYENPFIIMFPIHLSTFLMTLVRKNIITNNQWHVFYALSLLVPYILNADVINGGNDKFNVSLVFIVNRLVFNFEKYTNMCALTFLYNALYVTKV